MDTETQYLKYKRKYQRIKSSTNIQRGGNVTDNEHHYLNETDAMKEISMLIGKEIDTQSTPISPQDVYDRGFISSQLMHLTGKQISLFENNTSLNVHYITGFEDGNMSAQLKKSKSPDYKMIYRNDYVLPERPLTPQEDIINQSAPIKLSSDTTDKVKEIYDKYAGNNGFISKSFGEGKSAMINAMNTEITQIINEQINA